VSALLPATLRVTHPSECFIAYLMTRVHPSACDDALVHEQLAEYRLPQATDEYFAMLRARLEEGLPDPYLVHDAAHRPTAAYLRRHGVYELHHPTDATHEACKILVDLSVRQKVEVGLLGRVDVGRIASETNRQCGVTLSAEGVDQFRYLFFEVDTLSLDEWSELLAADGMSYMSREDRAAALRCGPNVALHRMGRVPRMDSTAMLRELQTRSYLNYVQADEMMPQGKDKAAVLSTYLGSVLSVHKQVTTSEDQLRKMIAEFERIRVETDTQRPRALTEAFDPAKGGSVSDTSDVIDTERADELAG